jgi:hypothetical protein
MSGAKFDVAFLEADEPWARLLWLAYNASSSLRVENLLLWPTIEEQTSASLST